MTVAPPVPQAPAVKRHHWIVRLTHWTTFVSLLGMIMSGLQIYGAYARFGERGGPYYYNAFQDRQFPAWSRLGGWLAGALNWHFALMWPLIAGGVLYVSYLAYSCIVLLGMLSVLTGFAVYKPTQLSWLTALFGGFQAARYWHFWAVWIFTGFLVVHVILVFVVDPASLRAMISGWYRGRFPSHD